MAFQLENNRFYYVIKPELEQLISQDVLPDFYRGKLINGKAAIDSKRYPINDLENAGIHVIIVWQN